MTAVIVNVEIEINVPITLKKFGFHFMIFFSHYTNELSFCMKFNKIFDEFN